MSWYKKFHQTAIYRYLPLKQNFVTLERIVKEMLKRFNLFTSPNMKYLSVKEGSSLVFKDFINLSSTEVSIWVSGWSLKDHYNQNRGEEQLDAENPETSSCGFPDSKSLVDKRQRKSLLIIRIGGGWKQPRYLLNFTLLPLRKLMCLARLAVSSVQWVSTALTARAL